MKLSGIATFSIAIASLLSVPLAAESPADWEWYEAEPANEAFSVEVPCSPEMMASEPRLAAMLDSMGYDEGAGVACFRDGVMMVAGIRSAPIPEGVDVNIFDGILEGTQGVEKEGVVKGVTEISGRRAMVSQENDGETLARSAVIEMGPASLLLVITGGPMEEGVMLEEVGPILERYFASLEVAP